MTTFSPIGVLSVKLKSLNKKSLFLSLVLLFLSGAATSTRAATIVVPPGGDIGAAINAATFGDTIILQAGATYETPSDFQPYSLVNKGSGTSYITIKSSSTTPADGTRVTLADRANMAKLVVKNGSSFFDAKTGAHHFRFSNLFFTNKPGSTSTQLLSTNGYDITNGADFSLWPHDMVVDHCWFNPVEWDQQPEANLYSSVNTAIGLAGVNITIRDSVMKGFGGRYIDQVTLLDGEAVSIGVAPGPMTVDNNFMEAWFVQFFIGGGDTDTLYHATVQASPAPTLTSATLSNVTNLHVGDKIYFKMDHPSPHTGELYADGTVTSISGNNITFTHLVNCWEFDSYSEIPDGAALPIVGPTGVSGWNGYLPHNMTFTHNYFNKPVRWYNMNGTDGKGFFEIKLCDQCLIDGNIFDGNTGFTVTVRNQGGKAPWSNIKNFTFSNNLAVRFGAGLAFLGKDGQRLSETSSNIIFTNNLMYGDRGPDLVYGIGPKVFTGSGGGDNIQVTHNTVMQSGPMAWIGSGPANHDILTNFVWKDNITNWGDSPRSGYGCLNGQTHEDCTPGYVWTKSVMIGDGSSVGGLSTFPAGNWNPATSASVGFTNPSQNNYRLLPSSPYKNAASDGKDVGVDMDQLLAHLNGPIPPPTPTPTPTATPTPTPTATPTPTPSPTPTPTPGQYTIAASPSSVSPGNSITVSWAAPAGHNSQDWIGLYRTGSASNNYVSWQYMGAATSGNMSFIAPGSNGQYEFRCYQNNAFTLGGTSNLVTVAPATLTPSIQLSNATYSVGEGDSFATITVLRSGDTSGSSNINYATSDTAGLQSCTVINGRASERCDYATTAGTLRFAAGETTKSFTIPIIDDGFVEGNETFTVTLSGPTGATLGSPATATITINDNDTVPASQNPIDAVQPFITQQYIGFLGRLPDPTGLANWMATLNACPGGGFGENDHPECDRVHVSAGFFLSPEFQGRGYWAYKFYEVGFDRRPTYAEFVPDMALIGGPQSPESEALTKAAYTDAFGQRSEFTNRYNGLSDSAYLSALEQNAEVPISNKAALLAALAGGQMTRAQVLRNVVESSAVDSHFFIRAFVAMQFFGYLRRDPDTTGYNNWVATLNADPSNYRHMIFGFLFSPEYRGRFGTP